MCSSTSGVEWKKKKGSTVTTHLHTGEQGIPWENSSAWALLIQQFYNKIGFFFIIPKYSGHGVDQDDLPLEGVQLTAEPALGPSFSGGVKPQSSPLGQAHSLLSPRQHFYKACTAQQAHMHLWQTRNNGGYCFPTLQRKLNLNELS